MSFQRRVDHKQRAAEKVWIDTHWPTLKAMGLPPIIYCDFEHWADFLDNGSLDHHEDTTHFCFTQLSHEEMRRLRAFLEEHYGTQQTIPRLLGILRVRVSASPN